MSSAPRASSRASSKGLRAASVGGSREPHKTQGVGRMPRGIFAVIDDRHGRADVGRLPLPRVVTTLMNRAAERPEFAVDAEDAAMVVVDFLVAGHPRRHHAPF